LVVVWNGFFQRFASILEKADRRIDERRSKDAAAAEWQRVALKLNIAFLLLFEALNIAIAIYIMRYWS
jgi:hypothetical protein